MKNVELSPLQERVPSKKLTIAVADIETMNTRSSEFRCACVHSSRYRDKQPRTKWDLGEFFREVSRFDETYFYNLGFDIQFLRNWAFESGEWYEFQICSGSKLLGVKFTHKQVKTWSFIVKDLMPLVCGAIPASLEKACKDYEIPINKYFGEDKYASVEEFFDNCTDEEIEEHCVKDVQMTLELQARLREMWYEVFSVDICAKKIYSLPSASMRAFRVSLQKYERNGIPYVLQNPFFLLRKEHGKKSEIRIRKRIEQFCRDAYKGGYCNAHQTRKFFKIFAYDVISEYPLAIKAIRFPVGPARWCFREEEFFEKVQKIPGIAKVTVELDIPLICGVREGKLQRMKGMYTETLTSYEILSILRYGGRIISFERGVVFDEYDKRNTFAKYINRCLRLKAASKGAKRSGAKTAANAFYGKLGQKWEQETKSFHYMSYDEFYQLLATSENVIESFQFDSGVIVVSRKMMESPKPYMNVVGAALITGFSRIYMMENALSADSVYEDTDSVKVEEIKGLLKQNVVREGDAPYQKIGFWETEGDFKEFRCLAPKCYAGRLQDCIGEFLSFQWFGQDLEREFDEYEDVGEKVVKCKGVPRKQRERFFDDILAGKTVLETDEYVKLMSSSEGLLARNYLNKAGAFGGVRMTSKRLTPKPKEDWVLG